MRLLILTICSLALLGCRAFPPGLRTGEVAVSVPNGWSASKVAQAGVDQQWLDRFKDRSLKDLAKEAVANNPDLKAAESRIRMAAASAKVAGAAGKPQINGVLSGNRRKTNFIGFPDFDG
ncbi:MAG: outer membrane protein TolC, partial [Verrucomicrobiales bacterium]